MPRTRPWEGHVALLHGAASSVFEISHPDYVLFSGAALMARLGHGCHSVRMRQTRASKSWSKVKFLQRHNSSEEKRAMSVVNESTRQSTCRGSVGSVALPKPHRLFTYLLPWPDAVELPPASISDSRTIQPASLLSGLPCWNGSCVSGTGWASSKWDLGDKGAEMRGPSSCSARVLLLSIRTIITTCDE
jgi:hypothetical protein